MEDFKVNLGFICCLICSKWLTSVIFSSHCSILMGSKFVPTFLISHTFQCLKIQLFSRLKIFALVRLRIIYQPPVLDNKSKLLLFVLRHGGQIDLPLGKSTWQPQDDLTECKNPKTCNSPSCSQPSTQKHFIIIFLPRLRRILLILLLLDMTVDYQYCLRQLLTRSYVATSLNNSRSPLKNEHLYHPNYAMIKPFPCIKRYEHFQKRPNGLEPQILFEEEEICIVGGEDEPF
ncbi:hypothetical protein EGR_02480 [Echinococcus granulosus]|uniref:Uncharacterized protein n=1 Tax=Echinococcus granulosus TaxID=6210 RepID=W6V860_ECHGR|nr:hypothetical protein EGR_02480 [Echinococcus granulosus]EUB62684.1 hypothetical protein EGR_02480 [Echinococcus granulosus]